MVFSEVSRRLRQALGREQECKHHQEPLPVESEFTDPSDTMWYLLRDEVRQEPYWSEADAAFVKLVGVEQEYVCLGCGESTTVQSGRRLGGQENIRMKEEMSEHELKRFQKKTRSGVRFNSREFDGSGHGTMVVS